MGPWPPPCTECWRLWDLYIKVLKVKPSDDAEERRIARAWNEARARRLFAQIEALPDDAPVETAAACRYLDLSNTALFNWIYKGKLTGTKKMKGPRGFTWTVPAGEIRRIRAESAAAKKGV